MTAIPERGPLRLTADWILPISAPPIRDGALLVGDDGRIAALGPAATVPVPPDGRSVAAGAVLMPGFVNAHTHLELTGLAGRVEDADFTSWIRGVRELKASLTPEWFEAAARQGVRDAFASGITAMLDTGDSGAVLPALVELGGVGVVYQEVFGPDPAQLETSLSGLAARVAALRDQATDRVRVGVSPHAPYTVSGPLYRAVARLARDQDLPIAVHLAESAAETAFVTRNEGPFAAAWRGRGIPPLAGHDPSPSARRSPVQWLDHHGVLTDRTLAIHAVQVDAEDLEILARRGVAIAHCPVSNARHGHGAAPVAAMRRSGVRLAVGTDSVVSVGRLDMFAELRAAAALLGTSPRETLALGTMAGAALLGIPGRSGCLEIGRFADLIALSVPGTDHPNTVEDLVIGAGPDRVEATWVAGRLVHRRVPSA